MERFDRDKNFEPNSGLCLCNFVVVALQRAHFGVLSRDKTIYSSLSRPIENAGHATGIVAVVSDKVAHQWLPEKIPKEGERTAFCEDYEMGLYRNQEMGV